MANHTAGGAQKQGHERILRSEGAGRAGGGRSVPWGPWLAVIRVSVLSFEDVVELKQLTGLDSLRSLWRNPSRTLDSEVSDA